MTKFSATYDTRFVGLVVDKGALEIAELPHRDSFGITLPPSIVGVRIPPKKAKAIIAELEDAGELEGYGDDEINTVQHWILARAYHAARSKPDIAS